jgi:hypothetical protein
VRDFSHLRHIEAWPGAAGAPSCAPRSQAAARCAPDVVVA